MQKRGATRSPFLEPEEEVVVDLQIRREPKQHRTPDKKRDTSCWGRCVRAAACTTLLALPLALVFVVVLKYRHTPLQPVSYTDFPIRTALLEQLGGRKLDEIASACHARPYTDAGGLLAEGAAPGWEHKVSNPNACCTACQESPTCNVWVYNDVSQECWLKHQSDNHFPERPLIYVGNSSSPWTSGVLYDQPVPHLHSTGKDKCVQVVVTSNGGAKDAYTSWQTKILYTSWLQLRADLGGRNVLTHFTRVLHRTTDDELSAEIPTVRVDPRRTACDSGCDFPVGDRAAALHAFTKTPQYTVCSHIMLVETDYLFINSPSLEDLPGHGVFYGYPFGYISPSYPNNTAIAKRYFPGNLDTVAPSGPAPGIVTTRTFKKVAPIWETIQEAMDGDLEAVQTWGWVRDMYSFSFALARAHVVAFIPSVPFSALMVQIPADDHVGNATAIHYTWGPIVSLGGNVVWSYDKRKVRGDAVVPIEQLPPWHPDMRLQAGEPVNRGVYNLLRLFVLTYNRALGVPRASEPRVLV